MKPLSILVADDEPGLREFLHGWLEHEGHRVACVRSGREATALLQRESFDVLIADILMAEGDGLELIARSRALQPGVRIVAMSGGGRYLRGEECLRVASGLGADAALLKPFSLGEMRDGIGCEAP